jgi:hypothetical protein
LPVFVVQAAVAASLVVTAIAAIRFIGATLSGREWAAVAVVCVGLDLLGCLLDTTSRRSHPVLGRASAAGERLRGPQSRPRGSGVDNTGRHWSTAISRMGPDQTTYCILRRQCVTAADTRVSDLLMRCPGVHTGGGVSCRKWCRPISRAAAEARRGLPSLPRGGC